MNMMDAELSEKSGEVRYFSGQTLLKQRKSARFILPSCNYAFVFTLTAIAGIYILFTRRFMLGGIRNEVIKMFTIKNSVTYT